MIGFGDFDGHCAAVFASEFAAALETFVGAFETFDGKNGSVFDDDGLTDFEPGDFFGDVEAEREIAFLFGGEAADAKAGGGHLAGQPGHGGNEFDTFLF